MEQKITVRNNQSLLDIAIQEAGTVEAIAELIEQNDLALSEPLPVGKIIGYTAGKVNTDILNYYKANDLHPATGLTATADAPGDEDDGGIGIWAIEVDFKVS